MMVQINPAPFVVVQLGIGVGQIFLNAGDLERGPVANVATTDAMHTYRLELSGTTAGSAVKVYYDGVLTLTGSAYGNPSALGSPVILWGEISTIARGTSEWEFVEQNAVPAPVPTATPWITLPAVAILCVTGLRALGRRARALDAEEREARARSSVTSQTGCAELRRSGVAVDGMESADGPQTVR